MSSSISVIVGVVLVLVAISVVFAFAFGLKDDFKKASDSNNCKASVIRTSLTSGISSDSANVFSMCPSKALGVLEEKEYSFAKLILDESENCWSKFGEGKLNPVPGDLLQSNNFCFSCASFQVKDSINNFPPLLDNYLEIGSYNLDNAFFKNNDENIYLINGVKEGDEEINIHSATWYSIINVFKVDKDFGFFWNSHETKSKIVLIKNSDVGEVCDYVENV